MAVSNEQFLVCCIDNSTGGSVNWQKVADTCGLPSKGAASIKFKRMKEKFAIVGSQATTAKDGDGAGASAPPEDEGTPKPTKKTIAKKGSAKKRKLNTDDQDDEEMHIKGEDANELA